MRAQQQKTTGHRVRLWLLTSEECYLNLGGQQAQYGMG